ncbi:MAG: S-layer homology domain-containing protein [Clostridia bacterium]|nr:S-layer homology domain-containing protein [Clostridia bacterium]
MKKILSVLLCLLMCFEGVNALAFHDYPDVRDEYVHVTDLLYDLEIIEGDDEGNFNPDSTLTRAEAAAIMVRLLGKDARYVRPGEIVFSDVDSKHWAAGYIERAKEDGIVNGMDDGSFNPEGEVTYHQFVKMLVCVLGYEPVALANGGWNGGGYLYAGSRIVTGITHGIGGKANDVITRMTAARMVYNALDVELMDENSFSTGIEGCTDCFPEYNDVKTIMTEYLNCSLMMGIVTKISEDEKTIEIVITDCDCEEWTSFRVGQRRELANCDRNANELLGNRVEFFAIGNKFLKGAAEYRNDKIVLTPDLIKELTPEKIVYYKNEDAKATTEANVQSFVEIRYFDPIKVECNVIVNGKLNPDFDVYEEYKNLDEITFLDNDNDSDFEFIIVNTEE